MKDKQTVRCNECAYRDGETCQLLYQEEHDRRYGFAVSGILNNLAEIRTEQ